MMKIQIRPMTVSCHCSKLLTLLLAILTAVIPLSVSAQRTVWELPGYMETMRVGSVALGEAFARDTYLSASSYDGFAIGFENDNWTGKEPDRLFRFGRNHADLYFGFLTNPLGGGSTLELSGREYAGFMWPAVNCRQCDLLIGPAAMCELGVIYNQQNSNNPVNINGYVGAGVCVDNTFRFSVFRYGMALQATLFMPLAGIGFAPDYDQPYWYMLNYGDFGKALHFTTPFNNTSLTQQVALVFPVKGNRLRIGYTFDYTSNSLGGHSRRIGSNMFTIGCAFRYQTKSWDK